MLVEDRQQELIKLCTELIQHQSYSGEENEVAERIKQAFTELGFDDYWVDCYYD